MCLIVPVPFRAFLFLPLPLFLSASLILFISLFCLFLPHPLSQSHSLSSSLFPRSLPLSVFFFSLCLSVYVSLSLSISLSLSGSDWLAAWLSACHLFASMRDANMGRVMRPCFFQATWKISPSNSMSNLQWSHTYHSNMCSASGQK